MKLRILLGAIGLAMTVYGAWRFFDNSAATHPWRVAKWLVGALVLNDGVLAAAILIVGWLLARTIPGRARAYVQGALVTSGLVAVVALPEIYRRGKAAPQLELLRQDYLLNLGLVVAAIAVVTGCAYLVRRLRDTNDTRD